MRKLALLALGGLLALPLSAQADDHEGGVKVYYKDGTRLEFPDADIKFNIQLQPQFVYTDLDSDGRVQAGGDSVDDTASFDLRRARLVISGNVLNKQFSYKLQNDFASDSGGGDLKDAWIQWNGDPANIRFGQMKVPYTRQQRISSSRLFFAERTLVDDVFNQGREQGAYAHAELGTINAYVGVYNGDSAGEGQNQDGEDNKLNGYAAVDFTTESFGSRGLEGDFSEDGTLGFTVGGAVLYGEGEADTFSGDFEQLGLNADAAVRVAGAELQAEYHYRSIESDLVSTDEIDRDGFYVQGTYVMDKLGFGGRFGLVNFDDTVGDTTSVDDIEEYGLVVNYFINGHYLKLQNAATWETSNLKGGGDATDFTYELKLAGYF